MVDQLEKEMRGEREKKERATFGQSSLRSNYVINIPEGRRRRKGGGGMLLIACCLSFPAPKLNGFQQCLLKKFFFISLQKIF